MKKIKRCLADDGYWKRKPCTEECPYFDTCSYKNNQQRLSELEAQEEELKAENRHNLGELKIYQSYSLERKIMLTKQRIEAWYEWWDGQVYVSFSGGKDSTVLLDLVRNACGYKDVPAVFVDTGLEYPEIREFVKGFDNVVWLKPKKNFKQVLKDYGYPFFTKEISEAIYYSRKYLTELRAKESLVASKQASKLSGYPFMMDMLGVERRGKRDVTYQAVKMGNIPSDIILSADAPTRVKQLFGIMPAKGESKDSTNYSQMYDKSKYKFMLNAPFEVSNRCCSVMKKAPAHEYGKKSGRYPMTGQTADESRLRTSNWVKNGCNGFYMKSPISNPMAFWTEQDVLHYIKERNLPIASVYGDVVEDVRGTEEVEGQLTWSDMQGYEDMGVFGSEKPPLRTTGCRRTGCIFCGYGCHLEDESRFEKLKETHPKQYEYIMKPTADGGLGYKEIIDWINENGNMHIKY